MPPVQGKFGHALALMQQANDKLEILRNIDPYLIDLSLRENTVGTKIGQTLTDKLSILPKLREFGFKNILLGTLDYAMPEELEVDDDFMLYLRDHHIDMTGCFAFTDIGQIACGEFMPSPSMVKLQAYGVPNALHEIYLSKEAIDSPDAFERLIKSLPRSIQWLHNNIKGDHGQKPRIIVNIVDGCDAFASNLEQTCEVLEMLSGLDIEGVSIEDGRGTYLPFQVGAFVSIARHYLPAPLQLLVHFHSGAGFENASTIEALLNGADGVWGGLPKHGAVNGHASLGELIANLVRVGNVRMNAYQLNQLLPLANDIRKLNAEDMVEENTPILGHNAYRLPLSFFRQTDGRFMDLAPEVIGGRYGYRVCPVVSDTTVIAGRLSEITGKDPSEFPVHVLQQMVRLMRRDLRAGLQIAYDDPSELLILLERAESFN